MRLGYINYLNCYPFYYLMLEKQPLAGVKVVPGYPSELNRMTAEGGLHMSPISSAAYAGIRDEVLIMPDFCLSSVGYVRSVVLISRVPIEELGGRRLGLSSASQTSVVLLKILLERHYGVRPVYLPTSPSPSLEDVDAALVIGNEAMMNPREPVPYSYDLGDLWLRKTGFPVVFAIFVVRRDALGPFRDEIARTARSYEQSLLCLHTERDALIRCAGRRYPGIGFDIDTYYTLLKFEFTDDLKKALEFYFSEAHALRLLDEVGGLGFLPAA
jgi:chorismate dehydratase